MSSVSVDVGLPRLLRRVLTEGEEQEDERPPHLREEMRKNIHSGGT